MRQIYLPYKDNLSKSVETLSDQMLEKQIEDIYEILQGADDDTISSHYKQYTDFLNELGYLCSKEYRFRFNYDSKFEFKHYQIYDVEPLYVDNSKTSKEDIDTLYKHLMCKVWWKQADPKIAPTWTNRRQPYFYKMYRIYSTTTEKDYKE